MTTQSSEARDEAVQEAVASPEAEAGFQRAGARARANSVPTALPVVHHEAVQGDAPPSAQEAARRAAEAIARLRAALTLPAGTSLLHAQPPSLVQTHSRHKEASEHWEAALARVPRRLWGYGHTVLKALLHVIEWVTESPARFVIAAAFLVACWYWL